MNLETALWVSVLGVAVVCATVWVERSRILIVWGIFIAAGLFLDVPGMEAAHAALVKWRWYVLAGVTLVSAAAHGVKGNPLRKPAPLVWFLLPIVCLAFLSAFYSVNPAVTLLRGGTLAVLVVHLYFSWPAVVPGKEERLSLIFRALTLVSWLSVLGCFVVMYAMSDAAYWPGRHYFRGFFF
jgi:hypothetical protein